MSSLVWRKSTYSAGTGNCVEVAWHKSSYSGPNGNCIEVGWRKSSFSTSGDCVEVGWPQERVAVRDSKNTSGPTLDFDRSTWSTFLAQR